MLRDVAQSVDMEGGLELSVFQRPSQGFLLLVGMDVGKKLDVRSWKSEGKRRSKRRRVDNKRKGSEHGLSDLIL